MNKQRNQKIKALDLGHCVRNVHSRKGSINTKAEQNNVHHSEMYCIRKGLKHKMNKIYLNESFVTEKSAFSSSLSILKGMKHKLFWL